MSITGKDMIGDIIDRAFEQMEVDSELFDQQFGDQPYGMHAPNDAQFLQWWQMKLAENPPVPVSGPLEVATRALKELQRAGIVGTPVRIVGPDQVVMFVSPFLLALALATNGDEWLGRYRAAVRRTTERVMQQYAAMEVA